MKTIFLFISTYVYTSDLLHTAFIRHLAEKFRVVVLLPMPSDPYPRAENITYVPWGVQFPDFWTFWDKTVRVPLIRLFDNEAIVQRNYLLSFGHWKRRLLRRTAFLFPRRFWNPDFIFRLESRFLPRSQSFERLVEEYHPSLVITPTPGFNDLDAEAVLFARRARIPTVAIDFSWDNLTSTGKHLRKTDYLICWTPVMKGYAVSIHGYAAERIFVSGIMRFDHYFRTVPGEQSREAFLTSKGLNPREKTILITTVTKGNYFDEPTVARELIRARAERRLPGFPNLFIRIHPKMDNFEAYQDLTKFPAVHVERSGKEMARPFGMKIEMDEADLVNLKDTLRHSDMNVNYLSTLSIEACIFDKPVVNIGFPPYYRRWYQASHYKPLVDAGAVRIAGSPDEFIAFIREYLEHPERDREKRAKIIESHVHFTDGRSAERTVNLIEGIAARAEREARIF